MKVLLKIGGACYLANTAGQAAKIADLLGNLTPLRMEWAADRTGRESYRLVKSEAARDSSVEITSSGDKQIFDSLAKFDAWLEDEKTHVAPPHQAGGSQ